MKVVTFGSVSYLHDPKTGYACWLNPGERYIFPEQEFNVFKKNHPFEATICEVSDLEPMLCDLPPITGWRKKRVLLCRICGLGDQLIFSSAVRFFREVLSANPFVCSYPAYRDFWMNSPYLTSPPVILPLHLDSVWRKQGKPFFEKSFFLEFLNERVEDSEQPNVYDMLFSVLGFDPSRIAAKFKRPALGLTAPEIEGRDVWLKTVGGKANRNLENGYAVLQMRANGPTRCLPLEVYEKVFTALGEASERYRLPVLCVDTKPLPPELAELVGKHPWAIDVTTQIPTFRCFASVIAGAHMVVGPDSSGIHAAAAFDVPALGIWGPYSPESRTKYYPNQIHLWHHELCSASPCFNIQDSLPVKKCPRGKEQRWCECFDGITSEEIAASITELLK